jgi:hypothetical protein
MLDYKGIVVALDTIPLLVKHQIISSCSAIPLDLKPSILSLYGYSNATLFPVYYKDVVDFQGSDTDLDILAKHLDWLSIQYERSKK